MIVFEVLDDVLVNPFRKLYRVYLRAVRVVQVGCDDDACTCHRDVIADGVVIRQELVEDHFGRIRVNSDRGLGILLGL